MGGDLKYWDSFSSRARQYRALHPMEVENGPFFHRETKASALKFSNHNQMHIDRWI
jgi:hypothetical protein